MAERIVATALALVTLLASQAARADEKQVCSAAAESAQSHRTAGKLTEAKKELVRCAQESCPRVVREACAGWLGELESELPSLVLRAKDAAGNDVVDVQVTNGGAPLAAQLDGRPIVLDPEVLHLRFEAKGFEPAETTVVLARGDRRRVVEVRLVKPGVPAPASKPRSIAPWIFIGAGGAALVGFGVLEAVAQSEKSSLDDGCGVDRSCKHPDTDPARDKFRAAAVLLGVGSAAVATGVIWIAATSSSSGTTAKVGLRPGGATLRLSF